MNEQDFDDEFDLENNNKQYPNKDPEDDIGQN